MQSISRLFLLTLLPSFAFGQALNIPWSGYAHDPQHTGISATAAQSLSHIHWSTTVDYTASSSGPLFTHYGSISVTAGNTVLVPVTSANGFQVLAFNGATGGSLYTLPSDYALPPHSWMPPYTPALSLGTRLYYAGAGGSIYFRDLVNAANGPNGQPGASGQLVFYGKPTYLANQAALNSAIQISTPITADRFGDIFFGFVATASGVSGAPTVSGLARIGPTGAGTWVSARALAGDDPNVNQVALNCAPALSNNQLTVYVAVSGGSEFDTNGYLVSLNAATLAPIAHAQLSDPQTGGRATISSDSSAAPMVGPDGDVFYGVLENPCCSSGLFGSDLSFTLNSSTGVYPPGNDAAGCELTGSAPCVVFSGVLTDNETDTSLIFLTGLSVDFTPYPSAIAFFNVDNTFYTDVPGLFSGDPGSPGDGNPFPSMYAGPVFGIDIAPGAPYGVYQLTAAILAFGGTNDPNLNGFTANTAFTLVVAPEPSGAPIIAAGLALILVWYCVRRTRC